MPTKGYLLPENIDPGTYKCLKVFYPDDPAYRRAIMGAVSYLQNWFAWDREAEHKGREAAAAFRIAYGMTAAALEAGETCDECGEPPEPPPPEIIEKLIYKYIGGGGDDDAGEGEEDDMGCQGPNPPIKIEGGKLYFWWCCDWLLVGDMASIATEQEPEVITPADPAPEDLSCRKAQYMAEMLAAIGQYGWDNFGVFGAVIWSWVGDIRKKFDFLELSKWKCVEAFEWANAAYQTSILGYTQNFPTSLVQKLVCQWVDILDPDTLKVSSSEFDQMKAVLKSNTNGWTENYLAALMDAIGKSGFTWMAIDAEHKTGANCACPDTSVTDPTPEWTTTWKHFWNFKDTNGGFVPNALSEWVAGQGWVDWSDPSTRYCKTGITKNMTVETGMITRLWVKFHVGTGFDYSGDNFKIETAARAVYGPIPAGGDPVTIGGDIILEQSGLTLQLGSTDNNISIKGEGHTAVPGGDPIEPDSFRIIAFAIGGTGADPWP